ncbi:MAG: ribonuclease HII [Clostridia bacterium]|nr:ribonuclease HII [Clostridia bacterium]
MFNFDLGFKTENINLIAGVDEAGRGPLAGPVCVAAVIMPLEQNKIISGVNDSKKLTEKKREALFDEIINTALAYKIELVSEKEIDRVNILNATKQGMKQAICGLNTKPDLVLIDAVKLDGINVPQESIIKGDAKSYNIAAASILAKVTRDRLMLELDKKYPEYNFKKHKGYGTKEHIENLKKFGKCEIHRDSFIKNFVGGNE